MKDHYPYATIEQIKKWSFHPIVKKYPDLEAKVTESLLVKLATRKQ